MRYLVLKTFCQVVIPMLVAVISFLASLLAIICFIGFAMLMWNYVAPATSSLFGLMGFEGQTKIWFGYGTVAAALGFSALMFGGTLRAVPGEFDRYWVEDRGEKVLR